MDAKLVKMALNYPTSSDQIKVGYSHAIADMNNDYIADLIVTVKSPSEGIKYQVLEIDLVKNQYKLLEEYVTPNDSFIYGQSLFADFGQNAYFSSKFFHFGLSQFQSVYVFVLCFLTDSDGSLEHLLPACKDEKCEKSAIFVRKDKQVNRNSHAIVIK